MENDINQILEEQQRELERIRGKKSNGTKLNTETTRKVLNIVFIAIAAVGMAMYFAMPEQRYLGLCVIGIGMVFKIVELFLRFMF